MRRKDFLAKLGEKTGFRVEDLSAVLYAAAELMVETLLDHEDVILRPLGRLQLKARPPRKRFIPYAKEHRVSVPKYGVEFCPSMDFRKALIDKYAEDYPDEVEAALNGEILGKDVDLGTPKAGDE